MTPGLRKVSDLAQQVRGVTYGKADASRDPLPSYLPILRAGNITDSGLVFDDLVYVPAELISSKQRIRRYDIVVATSSGSLEVVGKAAQALSDFEGGFGAFCKVLRPGADVNPRYLAHYFRTREYRQRVSALAAGANINNLKNEHLDELEVLVPALSEQQRIARILDTAESLRTKRQAAIAALETFALSIFRSLFGEPTTSPGKWQRVRLQRIITDGPQNGLYKPATEYGSGTPILRIDSFYDGTVREFKGLKRLRLTRDEVACYALRAGDIVVNRVNSMEYLGKSAVIPEFPETVVFESNMMRFGLDRAQVDPNYLIEYLQSSFVKSQIYAAAKHAVNQSSINQNDVRSFMIDVPPLPLQQEFARRVAAIEKLKAAHRASLAEMDALFASLQHRAFSGQL